MHWLERDPNTIEDFNQHIAAVNAKYHGDLFFLEVGAMDGVGHDALHAHIINNPGWRGLLVEPLPDMFAKLKANYAGRDNLLFENSAITDKNGEAQITRIPQDSVNRDVPEWADGISTLKPDIHIIGNYDYLKDHSVTETIKTSTFASLVDKYHITGIDVLQIDAEGYDKEIFDQIWAAGFRPSLIKIEINYLLYVVIRDLKYLLETNGYHCFLQSDDLIAVQL